MRFQLVPIGHCGHIIASFKSALETGPNLLPSDA